MAIRLACQFKQLRILMEEATAVVHAAANILSAPTETWDKPVSSLNNALVELKVQNMLCIYNQMQSDPLTVHDLWGVVCTGPCGMAAASRLVEEYTLYVSAYTTCLARVLQFLKLNQCLTADAQSHFKSVWMLSNGMGVVLSSWPEEWPCSHLLGNQSLYIAIDDMLSWLLCSIRGTQDGLQALAEHLEEDEYECEVSSSLVPAIFILKKVSFLQAPELQAQLSALPSSLFDKLCCIISENEAEGINDGYDSESDESFQEWFVGSARHCCVMVELMSRTLEKLNLCDPPYFYPEAPCMAALNLCNLVILASHDLDTGTPINTIARIREDTAMALGVLASTLQKPSLRKCWLDSLHTCTDTAVMIGEAVGVIQCKSTMLWNLCGCIHKFGERIARHCFGLMNLIFRASDFKLHLPPDVQSRAGSFIVASCMVCLSAAFKLNLGNTLDPQHTLRQVPEHQLQQDQHHADVKQVMAGMQQLLRESIAGNNSEGLKVVTGDCNPDAWYRCMTPGCVMVFEAMLRSEDYSVEAESSGAILHLCSMMLHLVDLSLTMSSSYLRACVSLTTTVYKLVVKATLTADLSISLASSTGCERMVHTEGSNQSVTVTPSSTEIHKNPQSPTPRHTHDTAFQTDTGCENADIFRRMQALDVQSGELLSDQKDPPASIAFGCDDDVARGTYSGSTSRSSNCHDCASDHGNVIGDSGVSSLICDEMNSSESFDNIIHIQISPPLHNNSHQSCELRQLQACLTQALMKLRTLKGSCPGDSELQRGVDALKHTLEQLHAHTGSISASPQPHGSLPDLGSSLVTCLDPLLAESQPVMTSSKTNQQTRVDVKNSGRAFRCGPLSMCCNIGCANLSGLSEALLPTLLCSGCRQVRYCSISCQRAAWVGGGHGVVCGV